MHTYIYIYIHIHTYTRTHTHIYIHIHTYIYIYMEDIGTHTICTFVHDLYMSYQDNQEWTRATHFGSSKTGFAVLVSLAFIVSHRFPT